MIFLIILYTLIVVVITSVFSIEIYLAYSTHTNNDLNKDRQIYNLKRMYEKDYSLLVNEIINQAKRCGCIANHKPTEDYKVTQYLKQMADKIIQSK